MRKNDSVSLTPSGSNEIRVGHSYHRAGLLLVLSLVLFSSPFCGGKSSGVSPKTTPVVVSVLPSDNSAGVAVSATVLVTFNVNMNQSTIDSSAFYIEHNGSKIPGIISFPSGASALFSPASPLENLASYSVTVKDLISSTDGVALANDTVDNFTTVASGTLPNPSISPSSGTYDGEQTLTIQCLGYPSAVIKYTVSDSTNPSRTYGTTYSSSFKVSINSTVKAIAYQDESGKIDSGMQSESILIMIAPPAFTPAAGTFGSDTSFTLTQAAADEIRYEITTGTTASLPDDPPDPTISSSKYSALISVNNNKTVVKIKAISIKSNMVNSSIVNGTYTIDYSITPARWGGASWGIHKWNP